MKKNKKAMIASLVLVGAVCVGSTLAYLSDQSNTLTNSFTVGTGYDDNNPQKLAVWVDEWDVDQNPENESNLPNGGQGWYQVNDEIRTLNGNTYGSVDEKLEPNSNVRKDPVIRLSEGSVESWVYMQIQYKKGEPYVFVKDSNESNDLAAVIDTNDWEIYSNETDGESGLTTVVVRYKTMLNSAVNIKDDEEVPITEIHFTDPLFDSIKITDVKGDASTPTVTNIVIKACAVQAAYTENGTKVYLSANETESPIFK